ncbi:hypothetical protein RJP21_16115 [Paenibacillus sp. VCA1]|uniref:hypothetical protein n=1 Tax=Paenibacillus sp. VCA1 TaxID=3039148 RepID=UPI0028722C52|nr:hypothetical protein [Paenibacillus sp. VCA1]MDR9855143.1 hypothetical protein [Paenibacillus sp. VCA1]
MPRLTIFEEKDFRGRSRVIAGNLGIENMDSVFGGAQSLRFRSACWSPTLVLFSRPGFKGRFHIYRGNMNFSDLQNLFFGCDVGSLISSGKRLSRRKIRQFRKTGQLPSHYRLITPSETFSGSGNK